MIYGIITFIRNKCYDWGIFKSTGFDLPVISVGNLSMGGTGKTPHVEYLINLLNEDFKIAILSRGYKRKTKGFLLADKQSTSLDIGDEPLQIVRKFSKTNVAVDESRVHGINEIIKRIPETEAIILDDAFQHRAVKPGLSILLTDFQNLYPEDYTFPVGTLREFRLGAKRADIIMVTKTDKTLSPITVRRITGLIKPREHQKLYFSYIRYGKLTPLPGMTTPLPEGNINTVLLVAGIANVYPLQEHVLQMTTNLETLKFDDHHRYTPKDYQKIRENFENIFSKNKIIITTEKDAMRMAIPEMPELLSDLPIYYIPIEIKIHKEFRKDFNDQLKQYVRENKRNSNIHQK